VVLFGFNRGILPFYAAFCFDELSKGSVLCLFYASFKKRFHNATTRFFFTEIDDHGVRQGNTGHMIAQWWRPVASKVALDMLRWAMCSALHWRIVIALKMAHDGGTFFRCRRLFHLTNRSKNNNNYSHYNYKLTAS
jgi:hypothetical protein